MLYNVIFVFKFDIIIYSVKILTKPDEANIDWGWFFPL